MAKRSKPKKRKPVKKKKVSGVTTKSKSHTDRNKFRNVDITIGQVKQHIAQARKGLEGQLKNKMLALYKATTKPKKRAISKEIAALKDKLKRLQ